jgi:hypothetical protein
MRGRLLGVLLVLWSQSVCCSDIWGGTAWGFYPNLVNSTGDHIPLMELLDTASGQERLDQVLQEMTSHGGTVWRMFVEIYDVLDSPTSVNASKINLLNIVLEIANRRKIRVLVSGALTFWVKRAPAWILNATDAETLSSNMLFWSALAKEWCGRPEILAFDMQNEPGWSWDDTTNRCRGWDTPGGCFDFIYNRQARQSWTNFVHALYPGGNQELKAAWPDFGWNATDNWDAPALPELPPNVSPADAKRRADHSVHNLDMIGQWAKAVSGSIRSQCAGVPVTVGALSLWSPPMFEALAPHLSYYSIHHYPKPEWNTTALIAENYRRAWSLLPNDSKPAFLEEFCPALGLSPAVSMRDYLSVVNETAPSRVKGFTTFMCGLPGAGNCSVYLEPNWGRDWANRVAEFAGSRAPAP